MQPCARGHSLGSRAQTALQVLSPLSQQHLCEGKEHPTHGIPYIDKPGLQQRREHDKESNYVLQIHKVLSGINRPPHLLSTWKANWKSYKEGQPQHQEREPVLFHLFLNFKTSNLRKCINICVYTINHLYLAITFYHIWFKSFLSLPTPNHRHPLFFPPSPNCPPVDICPARACF